MTPEEFYQALAKHHINLSAKQKEQFDLLFLNYWWNGMIKSILLPLLRKKKSILNISMTL